VDDESGIISCKVNPQKLYPQKKKPLAREASSSSTEGSAGSDTPRPTSDPRLWIYRYEKPPEPVRLPSSSTEPSIPILCEGTVVRVIGKIVLNAKKESIIDVTSITPVSKEERYAEWHHAVSCRKVREQLYMSRAAVRDLLDLDGHMSNPYKSAMPDSQSISLAEMSGSNISLANGSTLVSNPLVHPSVMWWADEYIIGEHFACGLILLVVIHKHQQPRQRVKCGRQHTTREEEASFFDKAGGRQDPNYEAALSALCSSSFPIFHYYERHTP
jgi:hypothetical protein